MATRLLERYMAFVTLMLGLLAVPLTARADVYIGDAMLTTGTYTLPSSVSRIVVELRGSGGTGMEWDGSKYPGGAGGLATASYAVSGGQVLQIGSSISIIGGFEIFAYDGTSSYEEDGNVYSGSPGGAGFDSAHGYIANSGFASTGGAENGGQDGPGGSGSTVIHLYTNQPPSITSALTANRITGNSYSYQITASNAPTSFGVSGLPSGLNFNASTGQITGSIASPGTYLFTVTATNANGTGQATVTWTVANAQRAQILSAQGTIISEDDGDGGHHGSYDYYSLAMPAAGIAKVSIVGTLSGQGDDVPGLQVDVWTQGSNWSAENGTNFTLYFDLSFGSHLISVHGNTDTVSGDYAITAEFIPTSSSLQFTTQPQSPWVLVGNTVSFTAVANDASAVYRWQRQAATTGSFTNGWMDIFDGGDFSGAGTTTLSVTVPDNMSGYVFRCIATTTSASAMSNVAAPMRGELPRFIAQPNSATIRTYNGVAPTYTLTVQALASPSPTYQWLRWSNGSFVPLVSDGVHYSGATSPTLTVIQGDTQSGGLFRCVATNAVGSRDSDTATISYLEMATPPAFTLQPQNLTVNDGGMAGFNVIAGGVGPITYQWECWPIGATAWSQLHDSGQCRGSASPWLTLIGIPRSLDGMRVRCVATNSRGTTVSAPATLTVQGIFVITSQPQDQTLAPGDSATFTITAVGDPPLVYRWHWWDGTAWQGTGFDSHFSGIITNTLSVSNASLSITGTRLRCMVYSGSRFLASNEAQLIVTTAPLVPVITSATTGKADLSAWYSYTITATHGATSYGAIGLPDGLSIDATTGEINGTPTETGTFQVGLSATNDALLTGTATLALTVTSAPIITMQPVSQTIPWGSTMRLSVVATGLAPLSYQWRKNGINIGGASSAQLVLTNFQGTDTGAYSVVVSNNVGNTISDDATVTITSDGGGNARFPDAKEHSPVVPGVVSSVVGGSGYDVQSGSLVRTVLDFQVVGAVGTHPLEMRRTYTLKGGWSHSFVWYAEENIDSIFGASNSVQNVNVYCGDGQFLNFNVNNAGEETDFFQTDDGIHVHITRDADQRVSAITLTFPDGATMPLVLCNNAGRYREFRPTTLTDPFGLVTTFTYAATSDVVPYRVTDASGRWLQFTHSARRVDRVESSCDKWIQWTYQSGSDRVDYWDGGVATYESGALPDGREYRRFSDVRQLAPMRQVEYILAKVGYNRFGSTAPGDTFVWELVEEREPGTGTLVSKRTVNARQQFIEDIGVVATGPAVDITETRGDGLKRRFTYGGPPTYRMSSASDFRGNATQYLNWLGNVPGTIRDALGRNTMLQVGEYGRISQITYADLSEKHFIWTGRFLTAERDERSNWTYFDRDEKNRVHVIRYPDDSSEQYDYNSFNQVIAHRVPYGAWEFWKYDTRGLLKNHWPATDDLVPGAQPEAPQPSAPHVDYTYYGNDSPDKDRVETITDPRNNPTTYAYNSRGQVTRETHADTTYRSYDYDDWGNRNWEKNELGEKTSYEYDIYNRLKSVTDPANHTTSYDYTPTAAGTALGHTASAVTLTTYHSNRMTACRYDGDYHQTTEIRGYGTDEASTTTKTYDAVGNLRDITQQVTSGVDRVTSFEYDQRNRKRFEYAPLNRTTEWQYDAAGNVMKVIHPDTTYTQMRHDSMNRVFESVDERNNTTGYYYLGQQLRTITDPRTNVYGLSYNSRGQLKQRTYPGGSNERWEYDEAGNVQYYYNRAGEKQKFTYDNRNRERLREWIVGFAPTVSTDYDDASRVISRANIAGTIGYHYESGQLDYQTQSLTGRPTIRIDYEYDEDGRRRSSNSSTGQSVGYTYNKRGLLEGVTQGSAPSTVASYTYYLTDQRRDRISGNLVKQDYGYDGAGRLDSLGTAKGATSVLAQRFGYDLRDRRKWSLRNESSGDTYEYFDDSQLQRYRHEVSRPDQNFNNAAGWTDTFDYDASGNRKTLNENGTVTTYEPDALNQYTSVTGWAIAHDNRGNVTQWGNRNCVYDAENRLISTTASGVTTAFSYDAEGRLVKIDRNGVIEYRYYDGAQCFLRTDGSGTQIDWTIWGPTPDEVIARYDAANGGWQYYHQDQINSVFAVTIASGNVIERYLYDPFGEPDIRDASWSARTTTAIGNPWMFTGQEWRGDMQMSNYKNRWYSAKLGRFLQNDPIRFNGGDMNLYRYCANNPINANDPDGKFLVTLGFVAYDSWLYATGRINGTDYALRMGVNGAAFALDLVSGAGGDLTLVGARAAIVSGAKVVTEAAIVNATGHATMNVVNAVAAQPPNPHGSRGKPDHQAKVDELEKKARGEAGPGEQVLRERKIQGHDSNRNPDVQIVDTTGKAGKIFEAERHPNRKRNIEREAEYDKLGVDHETHPLH